MFLLAKTLLDSTFINVSSLLPSIDFIAIDAQSWQHTAIFPPQKK